MQMRMPDRLRYSLLVDPALQALRFPPLALLTLVENAIRHGIDAASEPGTVEVGARREPSELVK
jgi:sensor histidine kinase YesM